jgi:hypothetical protein
LSQILVFSEALKPASEKKPMKTAHHTLPPTKEMEDIVVAIEI